MPVLIEESAQARVVADLKAKIENCDLKVGEQLPTRLVLARQLGVSHITIHAAISELAALGYVQAKPRLGVFVSDRWARGEARPSEVGLRSLGRNTIAILGQIPPNSSEQDFREEPGWATGMIVGALDELRRRKMHALTLDPGALDSESLAELASGAVAGAVVPEVAGLDVREECLRQFAAGHARVAVGGDEPPFADFDRVVSDHELGSYLLTRYLIGRGRRRIVPIWSQPDTGYWFANLRRGYERAMLEAGLEPLSRILIYDATPADADPAVQFEREARLAAGYLVEALQGPKIADAFVVNTDATAYVVAAACRYFGRAPNEDVDITGYDNYWRHVNYRKYEQFVPLATVDKQNIRIGGELIKLLLDRIEGHSAAGPQVRVVEPRLVVNAEAG